MSSCSINTDSVLAAADDLCYRLFSVVQVLQQYSTADIRIYKPTRVAGVRNSIGADGHAFVMLLSPSLPVPIGLAR